MTLQSQKMVDVFVKTHKSIQLKAELFAVRISTHFLEYMKSNI